jgi:hypothetical protein
MTERQETDSTGYRAIPLAILIGFIGSVILYLTLFLVIQFWYFTLDAKLGSSYVYSWPVQDALNISGLLFLLFFSVLIGIFSYFYLNRTTGQPKIFLLAMGMCGLVYGIGFEYYIYSWDYLFYFYYPVFKIGQPFLIGFLMVFLVVAAGIITWRLGLNHERPKHYMIKIKLSVLTLLILLILTIVVPLGYADATKDQMTNLKYCNRFNVDAEIRIVDDSTVRIEAYGSGMECLVQETPFYITYDGVDISNQTAIERAGLNLSISSPDGLTARWGSVVYISGGDMRPDAHVEVGVYKITGERYVINNTIVRY